MLSRGILANEKLDLVNRVDGNSSQRVYDGIHRSLMTVGRFDEAENLCGYGNVGSSQTPLHIP